MSEESPNIRPDGERQEDYEDSQYFEVPPDQMAKLWDESERNQLAIRVLQGDIPPPRTQHTRVSFDTAQAPEISDVDEMNPSRLSNDSIARIAKYLQFIFASLALVFGVINLMNIPFQYSWVVTYSIPVWIGLTIGVSFIIRSREMDKSVMS